jgi:putative membrane protein
VHAATTRSWRHAGGLLVVAAGVGFVAEAVGVHSGVPFGRYRYTGGLGPRVLDVPVVVPLAWAMMAHPAHAVAARLVDGRTARVAIGAFALASWDVFLDPQMVDAGHWRWSHPSPHLPGIGDVPLTNFGGWLLVAAVILAGIVALDRDVPAHRREDGPAVALWVWTWLSSALADLAFLHRPAVAGWGLVAMGCVGVPLVVRLVVRAEHPLGCSARCGRSER